MAVQPAWCQHPPAQTQQAAVTSQAPRAISSAPYDVASIRISHQTANFQHVTSNNGSLLAENSTLRFIIRFAYELPDQMLVGGPAWINETKFDVRARTDAVQSVDRKKLTIDQREAFDAQKQVPLQKLLGDRFQLKLRREDRVMPFYALVLGKSGLKIKPSTEMSSLGEIDEIDPRAHVSGFPGVAGLRIMGRGQIVVVRTTLDQLARYLTGGAYGDVDRPVLNKTGLTGQYDFTLNWTPASDPDSSASAPSLFTAIQEQLGLKLEPQKGPVEVMVIDHVELPSEN